MDPLEQRLAVRIRVWSDQAVEPIDALAIARATASTAGARAGLVQRLRSVMTTDPGARSVRPRGTARPIVAPLALVLSLAALTLATFALILAAGQPPTRPIRPSPTASDDLLERLGTVELAPGVYRVLHDGTEHDLAPDGTVRLVKAGPDGSVWVIDAPDPAGARRFFRLTEPGTHDATPMVASPDLAIGQDGTVWTIGSGVAKGTGSQAGPHLLAWSGTWVTHDPPTGHLVNGVEVGADGSVLVTGFPQDASGCPGRPVVWRVSGDGWRELPSLPAEVRSAGGGAWLATGADGTLWLAVDTFASRACVEHGGLYRFDGSGWRMVEEVPSGSSVQTGWPTSGQTGAMWVFVAPDQSQAERILARHAAGSWTTFGARDRVPAIVGTDASRTAMGVGLDDTLYMAFGDRAEDAFEYNSALGVFTAPDDHGPCPGVRAFDGKAWRHHLEGRCASDLSVAPDGRIWVVAKSDPFAAVRDAPPAPADPGLYVIDPARLVTTDGPVTSGPGSR